MIFFSVVNEFINMIEWLSSQSHALRSLILLAEPFYFINEVSHQNYFFSIKALRISHVFNFFSLLFLVIHCKFFI